MTLKPKEAQIQKVILQWLSLQKGTFSFRTNNIGVPMQNGGFRPSPVKGLHDILCCKNGRFIALEVKAPGGKLSKNQKRFLESVESSGGVAAVVTSLEEVQKMFLI